jgi:hypothetical protein
VAIKPFNSSFKILGGDGFLLINGEQITKIAAERVDKKWKITFHLSDGSKHTIGNKTEWAKAFIKENFEPTAK